MTSVGKRAIMTSKDVEYPYNFMKKEVEIMFGYKRVSGLLFLILSFCTFGIYPLCMWARMTKNMNKMAKSVDEKGIMRFLPAMILGTITCGIYEIIWIIKFFSLMAKLNKAKDAGVTPGGPWILMLLMGSIPLFNCFWLAKANNKLVDAYSKADAE